MKRNTLILAVAMVIVMAVAGAAPAMAGKVGPGMALDVKFAGVITIAPAQAGDAWEIGGQTVVTNESTRIRLRTDSVAEGMWADVTAQRQPDGSLLALQIAVAPPEMRLKGPIAARPADAIGAWTVAGQVFQVTADTKLSLRGAALEVGDWAEVYAVEDAAGGLVAARIRGIEVQQDIEVYGAIQVISETACTLSAVPLVLSTETLISDEPQVGLLAHASAALEADGTLAALTLRVEWLEPRGIRPQVRITGTVEGLPSEGLNGNWVVDGQTVVVTPATVVIQVKGLVEVGARVHVLGWSSADTIIAAQVTVLECLSCSGQSFHLAGAVEAMPPSGVLGTWRIAGQQVQVTQQTRLQGMEQARVGMQVEAGGQQLRNGVRTLTWLRTRDQDGAGPKGTPDMTPGATRTPGGSPEPVHTPQPTRTPGGGPGPLRTPLKP